MVFWWLWWWEGWIGFGLWSCYHRVAAPSHSFLRICSDIYFDNPYPSSNIYILELHLLCVATHVTPILQLITHLRTLIPSKHPAAHLLNLLRFLSLPFLSEVLLQTDYCLFWYATAPSFQHKTIHLLVLTLVLQYIHLILFSNNYIYLTLFTFDNLYREELEPTSFYYFYSLYSASSFSCFYLRWSTSSLSCFYLLYTTSSLTCFYFLYTTSSYYFYLRCSTSSFPCIYLIYTTSFNYSYLCCSTSSFSCYYFESDLIFRILLSYFFLNWNEYRNMSLTYNKYTVCECWLN